MIRALPYLMLAVALAGVAAFFVWAFQQGEGVGGGWESLGPIWLYVAGGLVVVAALTGGLMWLAFYSSRRGYDEPFDINASHGGPTGRRSWTDRVRPEE